MPLEEMVEMALARRMLVVLAQPVRAVVLFEDGAMIARAVGVVRV